MRFSLFAVLSCLAALATVNALPVENVEITCPRLVCCIHVSPTFRVNKQCMFIIMTVVWSLR
jgi:hypothetical protein